MKSLIINADDFGLSKSVNNAVMAGFKAGNLTSTTLMVNTQATAEAIVLAKKNPSLGVGLHFNLTFGQALAKSSYDGGLTDTQGEFLHRDILSKKLLKGHITKSVIEAELKAQFAYMADNGLVASHIDGHQHIQAFPRVFDCVAGLCAEHNIPIRMPWLLSPAKLWVQPGRFARQLLLRVFLLRNEYKWRHKLTWNTQLASVFDLGLLPKKINIHHYESLLNYADDGVFELMVHPAEKQEDMVGLTAIGALSETEGAFLKNGNLGRVANNMGFVLHSYNTANFEPFGAV